MALKMSRPTPARLNTPSMTIGTPEKKAEVDAQVGDHGDDRIAQRVLPHYPPSGQALGDGGADVLLSQALEQRRPGEATDRGQAEKSQDQGGTR